MKNSDGWDLSCPDWGERLAAGRSLIPDLPLNRGEAERAVAIYNSLRLPDVAGFPKLETAGADWFRDGLRVLFGSLCYMPNPHNPGEEILRRLVNEIFWLVPKKNNKTTGGAAMMMTGLLMNQRPLAEFTLIGPTQEIADSAFKQAAGMRDKDPELRDLLDVQEHLKTIKHLRSKATLKIKTFDLKVVTGARTAGVLIDELHILGGMKDGSRVIQQLRGGMESVPEAFLAFISTQSDLPPAGCFANELQYARAIRDGREAGHMVPVLYEFPEEVQTAESMPWRNPEIWPQVLPNLGLSVHLESLKKAYAKARAMGEAEERLWASQFLNIEIGLALHAARWNGADHWQQAEDEALTLDSLLARSEVVVVGVDGGGLDDLLGMYVLGREKKTHNWLGWGRAWVDVSVLKKRQDIAPQLEDFERDGDLVIARTPGEDLEDFAAVVDKILLTGLLPKKYAFGLDAVGVKLVIDELEGCGITEDQMAAVPQGYRLSGTIKGTARRLRDKTIRPADQRLMRWCVGNAKAELKGSATLITKQAAGAAKIDPLQAAFNAVDLMGRHPKAAGRSYLHGSKMAVV